MKTAENKDQLRRRAAATLAPSRVRPASGRAGGAGLSILIIITLSALMVFAFPSFVLIFAGMAPTWVAIIAGADRNADRLRTIAACNFAGVTPYLVSLWAGSHSVDFTFHLLGDVFVWAAMYSGAGAGMAALWFGPHLAALFHGVRALRRRKLLDTYRKALLDEWGMDLLPPTDAPAKPAPGKPGS